MNQLTEEQSVLITVAQKYVLPVRTLKSHRMFTCNCCGYPTLESKRAHLICPLCDWVNGQEERKENERWPDNEVVNYSLKEAQSNFKEYLVHRTPGDSRMFCFETIDHILQAKQNFLVTCHELFVSSSETDQVVYEETLKRAIQRLKCTKAVEDAFDVYDNGQILFNLPELLSHEFDGSVSQDYVQSVQVVLAIGDFVYQVSNGGLHQFLCYTEKINLTLLALDLIGANRHRFIVNQVTEKVFPKIEPPETISERVHLINAATEGRLEWFEDYDSQLSDLDEDIEDLYARYANQHKSDYALFLV